MPAPLSSRWKFLGVLAAALLIICAFGYGLRETLYIRLMGAAFESNVGKHRLQYLDDGLHLALCGAGSPMPDPDRSGPCVAVIAGQQLFIVDAGAGAATNLGLMAMPIGNIASVFVTHMHSDHIDGLGQLGVMRWITAANKTSLPVYGPKGIDDVVSGFNLAYRHDAGYRQAHHGDTVAPLSGHGLQAKTLEFYGTETIKVIYQNQDLRISVTEVEHQPIQPALAYRFDYKGRSLVISGDTVYSEKIVALGKNVDLMVHDALSMPLVKQLEQKAEQNNMAGISQIAIDIRNYHASPEDAGRAAQKANAKHLLLYHLVPPPRLPGLANLFKWQAQKTYSGDVSVGIDGLWFSLPANSHKIIHKNVL